MTNRHGAFIWYELMTPDMDAARIFYEAVAGWKIGTASGQPGMDYRMIDAPDASIGGMMRIDADMIASGARPVWVGYVAVEDVEASMRAIGEAGGHVHMSREIPGVGRFAMASDPQGALFYVMRGSVEGGVSTAFAPGKLGHCAWNELWTPDQDGAHAFYTALFGWRQEGVMPMGAMGDYCFLHLGETRFGATGGTDGPAHWLPYFTVPSIGAAVEAVKAHGGTVTTGPHEVPGGGHIVMGVDPQGARFALVADQ